MLAEIARLGLEHNAWELDTHGYTVLAPDQVGPPEFARVLLDRILTLS